MEPLKNAALVLLLLSDFRILWVLEVCIPVYDVCIKHEILMLYKKYITFEYCGY